MGVETGVMGLEMGSWVVDGGYGDGYWVMGLETDCGGREGGLWDYLSGQVVSCGLWGKL